MSVDRRKIWPIIASARFLSYSQYYGVLPLVQKYIKVDCKLNASVVTWPTRYESLLEQ